jgi:hypothetical protein
MNPFNKKTSWIVWIILVMLYMYMAGSVMSGASVAINSVAGDSSCSKPLDLIITGIDYNQSYSSLECMGSPGRNVYKEIAIWQDSIYPVVYGLLFFFTLLFLSSYCVRSKGIILSSCLLPVLIVIADFLENHFIVTLIDEFPNLNTGTIRMLSVFNSAKWSLFFLAASLIVFYSGWALFKIVKTVSPADKSR